MALYYLPAVCNCTPKKNTTEMSSHEDNECFASSSKAGAIVLSLAVSNCHANGLPFDSAEQDLDNILGLLWQQRVSPAWAFHTVVHLGGQGFGKAPRVWDSVQAGIRAAAAGDWGGAAGPADSAGLQCQPDGQRALPWAALNLGHPVQSGQHPESAAARGPA